MASAGVAAPVKVSGTALEMVFEAACLGDLPLFKSLVTMLDEGKGRPREAIEALREEEEGLGALHHAALSGSLEVCRYLVEELRVDVDGVDKRGRTPLLCLVMCSKGGLRVAIAKYLLDHGANRDKADYDGLCKDGAHVAIAKYLLDHGANGDKADYDGLCPLHIAAGSGDCDMVELLLAKGAYVDLIAPVGTPLHIAAGAGHYGTMKILLDHNADYNKIVNGKTPLTAANDGGSEECVRLLFKVGADAKGALTYCAENLKSSKLVSKDFVDCMLEDIAANSLVPDDDEPVYKKKVRAAGFKKLGSHTFKLKDYVTAAGYYSVAISFNPGDATLFSNRSFCCLLMGDRGKALADANQCRRLRPEWPKACYRQGAVLMSLKDYEGASERFLDGLKLDPGNAEIEFALREAMKFWKNCPSSSIAYL